MTVLRLNDVSLSFGVAPVLDCIDLTIERGERVCLVGRNGQGKSSLMKLIGGLLQPDSGTVQLGGSMRVAYLPQDVPSDVSGTITDVVGDAHREIFDLLTEYQSIADSLATDPDEKKFGDLERIQFELDERSGWDIQDRIANHLRRFKLDGNQRFETLSGGMKRRVLLARCLVSEPDLLMLDEPTNHLDIPSIAWLEACLQSFQGALLFVTHDRMFLRKIATRILDLDRGRLTSWPGDFDLYQKRKDVAMQAEENEWRRFDKKLAEEEAWIRQGIKARRTRNEGRVRALKRLRQDRQKRRERIGKLRLNIGDAAKSGKDVITAHDISFCWPKNKIVSHFSTRILRGDRIGIIGPNGCGKSTLLKLLLGELEPQDGQVELGTKLDLLYFDQLREQLDQNATVAENVSDGNDMVMVRGTPRHVVGYLRDFLFSPQRVRSPVHVLSGGEKNRLLLAKLFKKTANMIVLDEPTNDLDSESLELLESVLLQFAGTVLIVSHDREFLNNVVTSTIVFDDDGQIRNYAGGYDDWLQQRPQFDQSSSQPTEIKSSTEQPNEVQTKASVRKLKYSERQELQALPGQIEVLEAEQTRVEAELSDPELYKSNDDQFSRLNSQLVDLQERLAAHYDRWAELDEIEGETG